ncbi:acyl carrier protein [Roseateles sp. DAIF2]|uniref:acyl carrier protein n=1 Tax=Roseateles sp. DAIF2 TaxID=2714952 RepID=UPI0018A319FB|nr:acyl carrier protein [Roseateles sp. DAIF2]QPF76026.1 acyl carrier protein [Roseateles sp. DAIF2]
MSINNALREVLAETLAIDTERFVAGTPLLGAVPELDSMGVTALIIAMEQRFSIQIADEDVGAQILASMGSLENYVCARLSGWGNA